MNLSVIAIGDELLIGQVVDTNSGDIARHIAPYGWKIADVQVVADDEQSITRAIERAFQVSPVVITTGGLGPTKDDITKQVLCRIFGGSLQQDPKVLANVIEVVGKRGLKLNDLTAAQAMVPSSCTVIQNVVGTAPIMWFEKADGKILVAMPGVPFETRQMFRSQVFPRLCQRFSSHVAIEHRTIIVADISESQLATELAPWEESLPSYLHLAYLPKPGIIRLRLDGAHPDAKFLAGQIRLAHSQLLELVSDHLLADGDLTPAEILLDALRQSELTVATAESCTGGNIAAAITAIPGSSEAMNGGIVAYSNDAKVRILGVDPTDIATHGAVSIPVVEQMARGAQRTCKANIAMATSGIAGPGGGTPQKPVGTVCIAVATPDAVVSHTFHFPGSRQRVVDRAVTTALIMAIKAVRSNN